MFGLRGEQVVQRVRHVARRHAEASGVRADADDATLERAAAGTFDAVRRDRKLRRPMRTDAIRSLSEVLATWEVVVAAVGLDDAEARWHELRGLEPPSPTLGPSPETPRWHAEPDAPAQRARRVTRRPRRVADPSVSQEQIAAGLLDAVKAEASADDDPMHADGYDHSVWLEEWLELAVGGDAFDHLEGRVATHDRVVAALHQDREVLYVAAPTLHPDDVRAIVLGVLETDFDPSWQVNLSGDGA